MLTRNMIERIAIQRQQFELVRAGLSRCNRCSTVYPIAVYHECALDREERLREIRYGRLLP